MKKVIDINNIKGIRISVKSKFKRSFKKKK